MKREHPGHLARQKDVDVAESLNILLCEIFERSRRKKDCPLWLTDSLAHAIGATNLLISPLKIHRDELPKYLE